MAASPANRRDGGDNLNSSNGIAVRVRSASLSVFNANPQLGAWQIAGTVIAHAPNITELRATGAGSQPIAFNIQGHTSRALPQQEQPLQPAQGASSKQPAVNENAPPVGRGPTILNGLKAFWKFFLTPTGFIFTIYFLNIVAWGAMLFFLLLKAAPAMNHPTADDDNSPRKKWVEISSQILNALFCVTAFGLAPWRFRDLYLLERSIHWRDVAAIRKLAKQNVSWFRLPVWAEQDAEQDAVSAGHARIPTSTGVTAPPTPLWKLVFTVWMMILNTLLQIVLCYFMWHYNRLDRPTWATGTFIALGCGVAMFAGLMSWWEGRKVKKIEGPQIKVSDDKEIV